ncbi:MAG: preprotein translocase subunit SecG [Lachnospiraceae bacterium]
MVRTILKVVFVLVCLVLTVLVLLQEGKSAGLGAIAGGNNSDTYWGKNKGRSKEGQMAHYTKILAFVFIVLAVMLNKNLF